MLKVFIIAEAGVNHNGDIKLAKKMVDMAKEAGVDAVKFQAFNPDKITTKFTIKAPYQIKTTAKNESQYQMLKKLALKSSDYKLLMDYCQRKKLIFIASAFDLESIDMLNSLGLEIFKIPSGEITNFPYLKKIGRLKKKVIMSTGMANLGEIEDALEILISSGTKKDNITVLHCNTEYPTAYEDVNLTAMLTMKEAFKVKVGYSDHTLGIEVPIAAVALGAVVIEKHFTLNRNMEGPDHRASLELHELKNMVKSIRNIELALGDGIKKPSESERSNIKIVRKSIVAKRGIKKGEILTEDNITVKRAGEGISPMRWNEIVGRKALKDFKKDELIEI